MFCKSCGVAGGLVNGGGEEICRPCKRMLDGARIPSPEALQEALLGQQLSVVTDTAWYGMVPYRLGLW